MQRAIGVGEPFRAARATAFVLADRRSMCEPCSESAASLLVIRLPGPALKGSPTFAWLVHVALTNYPGARTSDGHQLLCMLSGSGPFESRHSDRRDAQSFLPIIKVLEFNDRHADPCPRHLTSRRLHRRCSRVLRCSVPPGLRPGRVLCSRASFASRRTRPCTYSRVGRLDNKKRGTLSGLPGDGRLF
jgi:hypothetical protein